MKKRIVSALLILCFLLSLFALSSCGKDEKPVETTVPSTEPDSAEPALSESETAEATTFEATTDKWEQIAFDTKLITERDRSLRIECSINDFTAVKTSKNDVYLKGPDSVEDGVTPLIEQMVYERNRAANDLLGTKVEFILWDYGWGSQAPQIDTLVKGKASDAPDLFVNMIYDLHVELLNGVFKDVWSIPGAFFDYSAEGWLKEWMENLSFTGDRAYVLGSDYFMDIFRSTNVLPFNMTMMDENADRLASAILSEGEELVTGETLTPRFFDLVEEGNWTWEVLGKICEAIWVDENGDGQDSITDRLGIIADTFGGEAAAAFVYSCGKQLIEDYVIEDESSAYNHKQWLRYSSDTEVIGQIFDQVKAVFEGQGSLSTGGNRSNNTTDNPGLAYHHTKFAAREVLFAGVCTLGGLEDVVFQEMTDIYSVVPCPKADASYSYNTVIFNSADAGAINVNANPRRARVLSAYLQYCTEHSPAIRNEFMQTVMKYKVTTYDQGTDRMLEIIYNSILWGRDKMVEDRNVEPRWHGLMRTGLFLVGSDYIKQQVDSSLSYKQSSLDNVMKTWYTLPKVEPTGN